MTSETQKHRNFITEPIGEKPVTELAGIHKQLGNRLEGAGFDKAYKVLGQFLVLGKDKNQFQVWLKNTCNANSKHSEACYQVLKDWCDEFLQ